MSDGARCHYCRKVPCVCHIKAEPPSPMERLEAWLMEYLGYRKATIILYGKQSSIRLEDLSQPGAIFTYDQYYDAAITAALAQAEGVERG